MTMEINMLKTMLNLYRDYRELKIFSAVEYLEEIKEKTRLSDSEISMFLELTKNQRFLESLVDHIQKVNSITRVKKYTTEIVLFLIMFVLAEDNVDTVLEYCLQMKCFYLWELITFLADVNEHILICQIACKYFEDAYVLENIIDPFLSKIPIILRLGREYVRYHEIQIIPPTKPMPFHFDVIFQKRPPPPANTPEFSMRFKAVSVPPTTWDETVSTERRILKLRKANREKANQLLLEASKVPERLTQVRTVPENDLNEFKGEAFKRKPILNFKKVEIKGNLTTTLREASRITRDQDKDIKTIDSLIKGGYSTDDMEKLEDQVKKENELQILEQIERNHLKGLLSYEQSILAKKKLLENTKQKMERFKQEKVELVRALQECREQEEQKIKALVEKSQTIGLNAKENVRKLVEKKQRIVKQHQHETRQMLEHAMIEKKKEFMRKVELIQEIKALHQMRCSIKEFDPTETPNIGLLCEMSIAELQERLIITKAQMKQELEEKRQGILKRKEEHRLMIENVKKIISENRTKKPKANGLKKKEENIARVSENPEILELRKRLEEKRQLRYNLQ